MRRNSNFFVTIVGSLFLTGCLTFSVLAATPRVLIKTTREGGNYLVVNNKPFLIRGVIYNPISPSKGYDYDFFSDPAKPWLVDGKLMKDMGINAIRIYSAGKDLAKTKIFIREMYEKFGIYTIVSDWLGLWEPGANYSDVRFQEKVKQHVIDVVKELRGEKGVLGWILGNENNYTFSGKIGFWTSDEIEALPSTQEKILKKAQIYYSFVNDIAKSIKAIDKSHPVALGNGEASFLDVAAKNCPDIDALAIIMYRGKKFGNFFNHVGTIFNKPMFLSEFGCDSYDALLDKENEDAQAEFLLSQWKDLFKNTVFSDNKKGACLGGFMFEWIDEWWKHNESYSPDWSIHNKEAGWSDGSYYFDIQVPGGMNMNEEWFGLYGYDESTKAFDSRRPKKSVAVLKDFLSSLPADIK